MPWTKEKQNAYNKQYRAEMMADPIGVEKERQRQRLKQRRRRQDATVQQQERRHRQENPAWDDRGRQWMQDNRGRYNARKAEQRARKRRSVPSWLTPRHREEIKVLYEVAQDMGMHVDHIIPLKGKGVCGLHVPWNLQVLTPAQNLAKGNRFGG